MKHLTTVLLLVLASPALRAAPDLTEARSRWLQGHYQEARKLYGEMSRDAAHRDAARIGLSRALQCEGEYDQALTAIDTALQDSPRNADLHARRAELLYLRGRWDEADKAASTALELRGDHFLAHWIRAEVYRDRGDLDKADAECQWFVRAYTQRSDNDNDIKDPDDLLLVGLAGCENALRHNQPDQFRFVLNDVYADALKFDKDFWPAEYQAGMLLLEKYNRGDALPAFEKALVINPRAAEALVGKGIAALQTFEIRDAERFAQQALRINPNLPQALQLRADVYSAGGEVTKALQDLDHARRINPRDENTLGRLAACLYLQHRDAELQKLIQEVEAHDPKPGLFYYRLGDQLEQRRRFDAAEQYYRKSTALRPMLPWAVSNLGLLCMRLGREKEARVLLTQGFEADPFNVRVSNTLKVLDHLEKYETLKTPHFEVRFDPRHDRLLARYVGNYLEEIYADLTRKFQFQPKDPYLVEIFNNHDMFSGRTIALPDLHTIGACTGRMVAIVSPRGKGIAQPFNWARVLRHETVHLFNLEQTHYLVPHWFTEGLAVSNEGFPRPQLWNELLRRRVPKGELMNLDDIDLGFIRPRDPEDWHMAYCQSRLYVQYMTEKYGPQTVGQLLDAYRDGLDTAAAIARVCKVDKDTFEKGYRAYLVGIVKALHGKAPEKPRSFVRLKEAHDRDPDNADVCAELAVRYLERGQKAEARKLAAAVLEKVKNHPVASYVRATLLQSAGEEEEARKLLEAAVNPASPEPRVLEMLAAIDVEAKEYQKAADLYELARKADPYDSKWLTDLVRVYSRLGDKEKLIGALKDLLPSDADDLASRDRLARLLEDAGRHAEAEQYARQALEIDVLDEEAQRTLGDALLAEKKPAAAIEAYAAVLEINDKADDARARLARAFLEKGDRERAAEQVARVLARDPDNAEAKEVRALLEK